MMAITEVETSGVGRAVLSAIWFLLPAALANMAPAFARKLFPGWAAPIDGGLTWRGLRLFGDHKTWRGLTAGILAGALAFPAQQWLFAHSAVARSFSWLDYGAQNWGAQSWLAGAALGFGALGGDLVKSFFKRRVGIPPGHPWFPFDQTDWLLGVAAVSVPWMGLSLSQLCQLLLVGLVLHVVVKAAGHVAGLDDEWI